MRPPLDLLNAFKEIETPNQMAILMAEDDFDAELMRVLAVWPQLVLEWSTPAKPCPDAGKPTPRAWAWLTSGLELDYVAIAESAGIARNVARAKVDMLIAAHLVYPDGSVNQWASGALQEALKARLGMRDKKKAPKKSADDGGAAN